MNRLLWIAAGLAAVTYFVGCTSVRTTNSGPPPPSSAYEPPKVQYSAEHDAKIKEVFALAKSGQWEEAEFKADLLYKKTPQDAAVKRLRDWVSKQKQLQREQAVENKIREIDAKNSAFNPTIPGLLVENKDRGLPARKDVRDVVEKIETTPYIPTNYGTTIIRSGPLFPLENTNNRMAKVLDKEVTIHLDNVTLETIVLNVGQAAGINFVADKSLPALKQTLSVNLDKVKLGEFLKYVARNYELQFQVGPDLVWIVDAKDPKKLMEETRFYRLRKGFVMPAQFGAPEVNRTITQTGPVTNIAETVKLNKFVNDGAPAIPYIEQAIKQFYKGTNYLLDFEHNLIVARGTPEQLEVLDDLVREFDKPIQQVLIEARFVTVTRGAFLQLGVLWESGRKASTDPTAGTKGTDFTDILTGMNVNPGLGLAETFTHVLGRDDLTATISALEQSGESQTLSSPRLTVINNLPATISDGLIQYYYEEFTANQQIVPYAGSSSTLVPLGKPTKLQSGATLDVLASIGGDGRSILLALHPQVNAEVTLVEYATVTTPVANGAPGSFTIKLPQARQQQLSTRVMVRSGQTVVMGGVLERDQRTYVESVPVLGSIPIIGALFRRRTEQDKPRYLLIFVTATILSESGEFVVYGDDAAGKK